MLPVTLSPFCFNFMVVVTSFPLRPLVVHFQVPVAESAASELPDTNRVAATQMRTMSDFDKIDAFISPRKTTPPSQSQGKKELTKPGATVTFIAKKFFL
jgi:hypothetical protein